MARVSQEHLDARRRQIVAGAARCFARDGFHATSMQDVLRETGLSAGAVYRYFPSKDAIIVALALDVLRQVGGAFSDAAAHPDPPAQPGDVLADTLNGVLAGLDVPPSLILQVWAETLRNPELDAVLQRGIAGVLASWTTIAENYQRRGLMRADIPPEHVARTILACAQGFLVQRALIAPELQPDVLRAGLRGLTSMTLD
ncbi:TetR/AcrR family transcriptional regulator [Streptomyces carpaticus]|uniref:TetR/AcrR family transcriptional regulator n=1 Tax=Streptomyces carpaticus TaxID=285558 RepID=A0ABV4ZJY3_9ACTN